MTRKELYSICHDEAVAYANSEQWSKRTGEEKSFLIQGYLDAMMEMRKSEITEMEKEYPKTYDECCEIMQVARPTIWFDYDDVSSISEEGDEYESHIENILCAFRKLRICRDAYWKLYGEEKGLGKPWEPDFDNLSTNLEYMKIVKGCFTYSSRVFVFPTTEMLDAFKGNFGPDIEICKELL